MGYIVGEHDVVLKVTVVHGCTCHKSAPDHLGSIYILLQTLQRMFYKSILPHMKKSYVLVVSKLPFLLSNNSLLSTECKEVANSVDFIYVKYALENFTSELLYFFPDC